MATYTDNYNLIKPSYSEVADVATINTNMNTIDDIMHSSQVSLAPAYDSTQTYNTGDVVMYELLMYKCKENGVTGTWNASKWERTTASECGDSGGGGTDVEANPSGTATEELNKLRVNNTIYSIPEGSGVVVYGEASGSIAEFDDGSNKPMSKCKIEINAVQDLHGYDNPWPAGGGKNLLPLTIDYLKTVNQAGIWSENIYVVDSLSFTIGTDDAGNVIGIKVNGSASDNTIFIIGKRNELLTVGESYTFSGAPADGTADTYCMRVANPTWTSIIGSLTITLVESTTNNIIIRIASGVTCNNVIFKPMVCVSTATDPTTYSPYSNICPISGFNGGNVNVSPTTSAQDGTTYSVSWQSQAGTVYGGTLDVVSGELVVDMVMANMIPGGTWTMETTANGNVFSRNAILGKALNYNFICNKYKNSYTYRSNLVNGEIGCYNNTNGRNRFSICDNRFSTVEDFLASLSDIEIAYELATPLTYQLTPIQVNSLLGANNVWNDTNGETEVKYIRDLNTTINILWNAVFNQSNTRSLSLMKSVKPEDTDTKEVEEIEEEETEKEVQKEIKKEEIND